jgi:membrane-associated protease RseP (regulator of RpoE activity)
LDNQHASDRPGDVNPKPGEKPIDTNTQGNLPPINSGISAHSPSNVTGSGEASKPPNQDQGDTDETQPIGAWLSRNVTWLILGAILFGVVWYYIGTDFASRSMGIFNILKVVVGLSLLIFVHELGHFTVAKLCNVHVQTFSIGFGPALPGCSFRRGETLYKLGVFPLGGYVKMVGEGSESEEGDDDPRSFKNKSVGQRMAIISAGVVMNVLLACVCFIIAYKGGVEKPAAVIGNVDAGSPAFRKGVRTGELVQKIGDTEQPYYDDLLLNVVFSGEGSKVLLVGCAPGGQPRQYYVEPRRGENDSRPMIGVTSSQTTRLAPRIVSKEHTIPARYGSPAAAARELDLSPEDHILASTVSDDAEKWEDLPPPKDHPTASNYVELSKRMVRLAGKPMKVRVSRRNKEEVLELPVLGFDFDDEIVGSTDDKGANPFEMIDLPKDDFRDPDGKIYDFFEFRRRMQRLAGTPVVLKVRRRADAEATPTEHKILVPPAFRNTLPGVRMGMGAVAALREGSAGEKAGVQEKDILRQVELVDKDSGAREKFTNAPAPPEKARELDPLRLPTDLRLWASKRNHVDVILTVQRVKDHDAKAQETLDPVAWDAAWEFDSEIALGAGSPLAIPELGIAYYVTAMVENITDRSPCKKTEEREGLQKGDVILELQYKVAGKPGVEPESAKAELYKKENNELVPQPWWANIDYSFQKFDYKQITVKVKRDDSDNQKDIELTLEPDAASPTDDLGLLLTQQPRILKAATLLEAVKLGVKDTYHRILEGYLGIRSMLTRRIAFLPNVQGPIGIALITYGIASQDFNAFLLILGFISINLAIVNFLPIPVLDGGHMVFLIYEKIRGKPASEQVRAYTTFAGLAMILSLMLVVIVVELNRHIFKVW